MASPNDPKNKADSPDGIDVSFDDTTAVNRRPAPSDLPPLPDLGPPAGAFNVEVVDLTRQRSVSVLGNATTSGPAPAPIEDAPTTVGGGLGGFDMDVDLSLSRSAQPAGVAASSGLPAHLQLPSIDFSLPPTDPGLSGTPPSAPPPDMQLPSFPDLGLPALPPAADEGPAAAPPPMRGRKTQGAPKPPPRRLHSPQPEAPADEPPVFGLPQIGLPDLNEGPRKRNLTLISSAAAQEIANELRHRRLLWPFIVLGLLGTLAVGAYVMREPLLATLAPKKSARTNIPPPLTPKEQAKIAFAEGVRAFAAKELPKAIESFDKALVLDASLGEAHRSLGIVYATKKDQAKAVEHYRAYLALVPQAADAADVQKIIDDYARAQGGPVPEDALPAKGKKAKGKRKGHKAS